MRKNRGVQIWTPHNTGVTANDNTPTKKRNIRPFRKTHLLSEQIASVAMTHKTSFYGTLRWLGGTPKTPWHLGGGTSKPKPIELPQAAEPVESIPKVDEQPKGWIKKLFS